MHNTHHLYHSRKYHEHHPRSDARSGCGTGCITTKETVEMSKRAEALGADILSVITPYFAAVSQDELYEHYKTVAEAVKIPIVLYNIPARTGCSIAPETVAKLAEIDNIVGAKDSSGNWDNLKAYIELTRDKDFAVISGNSNHVVWIYVCASCDTTNAAFFQCGKDQRVISGNNSEIFIS